MLAEPSAPAVRNWLLGMPAGFVIVAVTRPAGNPLSESSHVEPSGPVLLGRTLTFAPEGGGAGGFVRGAAVGAAVGAGASGVAAGGGVAGAALPGAADAARTEPEAAGRAAGVLSDVNAVPASQPMSATARTASATKRGCMPAIVRSGQESQAGVLSRGTPVAEQRFLPRIRTHCLTLPAVTQRVSHGTPAFFVGRPRFAQYWNDHHGDVRVVLCCVAPDGIQTMRVRAVPERFFVPPYVGRLGWLGMRLDR